MIGIRDVIGRLVRVARPNDDRTDEQVMEVWITPARPRWEHVFVPSEDGPYRIIRWADSDDRAIHYCRTFTDFSEALAEFVLWNLPAPGQNCGLIDGHDFMLLGWRDHYDIAPTIDERYVWFGCQAAFDVLGAIHNPVDAAMWERIARPEGTP